MADRQNELSDAGAPRAHESPKPPPHSFEAMAIKAPNSLTDLSAAGVAQESDANTSKPSRRNTRPGSGTSTRRRTSAASKKSAIKPDAAGPAALLVGERKLMYDESTAEDASEVPDDGVDEEDEGDIGVAGSIGDLSGRTAEGEIPASASASSQLPAKPGVPHATTSTLGIARSLSQANGGTPSGRQPGVRNARVRNVVGSTRKPSRAGSMRKGPGTANNGASDNEAEVEEGTGGARGVAAGPRSSRVKKQHIFTRADPKAYFSSERTMYSWMYLNILTLTYSLSLYAFPQASGIASLPTDTAATCASAAALLMVLCSAIRFALRQDRLAGTESILSRILGRNGTVRRASMRLQRRASLLVNDRGQSEKTLSDDLEGSPSAAAHERKADVFDQHVLGYPLVVSLLIIAVMLTNLYCIYRIPHYKPKGGISHARHAQ